MMRTTLPFLADWRPREVSLRWAGLRPYTPDGLPVIGPVPGLERLVVATGHGRMGITVAPPTGEAVADLLLEGRTSPAIEPFGIERALV
jgi:glycine/D-amino acid oxidase-like deaminating enzyme